MAVAVNSDTDSGEELSAEEESVLLYLERHPGASYRKITHNLEADPREDYSFTDIQRGLESLRERDPDYIRRETDGRTEYYELGEEGKRLLD